MSLNRRSPFFLLGVAIVFSALSLLEIGCRATPTPPPRAHLTIGSADSAQYIARELADAYRRSHPFTTFDFYTTNSTTALQQIAQSRFEIAFVTRNPRTDELERAQVNAVELGRDALAVIVNPSNPLTNISRENLAKVFSGEIYEWSAMNVQLTGTDNAIQVLTREAGSGMRQVLEEQVMLDHALTPTALVRPTNLDMLDYVSDHPEAIGYVAANIWDSNSHTRPLSIDNVPMTRETIASGTYPLLQTVFLILPVSPNETVSSFVEFVASSEGRQVLNRRLAPIPPK